VPVRLDVTDPAAIATAVSAAPDVTLLIDNAGISTGTRLSDGDAAAIRQEMETNSSGPLEFGVTALHVGSTDTGMAAQVAPADRIGPAVVAAAALDGVQPGGFGVIADGTGRRVRSALSGGLELLHPELLT
jgi:hypothetical protein